MNILNDIAPGLLLNLVMTAGLIAVCQLLLWLLSIKLRDASIVDIFLFTRNNNIFHHQCRSRCGSEEFKVGADSGYIIQKAFQV